MRAPSKRPGLLLLVMSSSRNSPRQSETPQMTRRRRAKMTSKCRVNLILGPKMTRTPANLQVSRGPSARL